MQRNDFDALTHTNSFVGAATGNASSVPYQLQQHVPPQAAADPLVQYSNYGGTPSIQQMTGSVPIQCWLHGCAGRTFSCLSNYRRHCKEKDGILEKVSCPRCAQTFSRKAAQKLHLEKDRCKVIKFDANGVPFRQPRWVAEFEYMTSATGTSTSDQMGFQFR
ncbi:hypothetical protein HD806DRAFT_488200 [Xylariaceae sp. AK1471]|nr:hypothetical protein HD806DRAFT_488200 [Xylariaceae sp. AK1471]